MGAGRLHAADAPMTMIAGLEAGSAALAKAVAAARSSGALQLSARGLTEVPPAVYQPDAALDANDTAGGAWWEAAELARVDLSRNEIAALPERLFEAGGLASLQSLDLSQNRFAALPPGLGALSALRGLSLSGNPLGPVAGAGAGGGGGGAANRGRLSALRGAGGGGGTMAAAPPPAARGEGLPDDVAALPALASLAVANCGLVALPERLGAGGDDDGLLPPPPLAQLLASGNAIARLPAGLARASALVRLELQDNALAALDGRVVAGWARLEELDVSGNQLAALPSELGLLARLRVLRARRNRLAALPAALAGCSALVELHAGFNAIESLPEALGALRGLAVLELRNNRLQELPAALCGLPLTLLDLSANSLRALPPELGLVTTLRSVPLDGNPLRLLRREVWAGPVSGLLEFLRSRLPDPSSSAAAAGAAVGAAAASSAAAATAQVAAAAVEPAAESRPQPPFGARPAAAAAGPAVAAAAAAPSAASADASSGAGGGELLLRGRGLTALPPELLDARRAALLARLDLSANPALGSALAGGGGGGALPAMPRLRGLALAGCGVRAWPLPLAEGALAMLQTLDLRGAFHLGGAGMQWRLANLNTLPCWRRTNPASRAPTLLPPKPKKTQATRSRRCPRAASRRAPRCASSTSLERRRRRSRRCPTASSCRRRRASSASRSRAAACKRRRGERCSRRPQGCGGSTCRATSSQRCRRRSLNSNASRSSTSPTTR